MKKRTIIWLAAAFVALVGAYLIITNWSAIHEHFWPTEYGPYQGDGSVILYNLGTIDDVTRIDWRIGEDHYSITRNEDGDFEAEDGSELDQQEIRDELPKNLYFIKASHQLDGVSKSDYELDDPWMEYTIWGGGTDDTKPMVGKEAEHHTIYFGTYNPVTETFYATMDDDDTVYLLFNKLTTHFGAYEVYAPEDVVPDTSSVSKISVTQKGITHTYQPAENDDGIFYSTVFSWYELVNGKAQAVNMDQVDGLYKIYSEFSWTGLEATGVEDLAPYGLDEAHATRLDIEYEYMVSVDDGNGNTSYETKSGNWHLLIGDPKDETHHYGMFEGTGVVDYITDETVEVLLNFDPDIMPFHVAVVPEWQTLKSIDITLPDERTCKLEIVTDDDGTRYLIEGKEVGKEDLRSVFLSLFNMPVDGIAENSKLSTSDAVLKAHFSRDRKTYAEMDLYLIPYNASLYIVDFAGEQRYLVSGRVIDGVVSAVEKALEDIK